MLALYASAFGSYGAELISITKDHQIDVRIFQTSIIIIALLINYLSMKLVSEIESVSVIIKLLILVAFIGIRFYRFWIRPENISQLTPSKWENTARFYYLAEW